MNDQTRKDRRWLWGVFCLALIAVMSSLLLRSVEAEGPSLRGKPALEWLDALVETNALSADAITVFQEAGAEVVPFLSARSTWYSSLSKLASDAQEWFGPGSFMYRSIDGAAYPWRRMDVERRRAAVMVLGQLGTHAEASLPVLLKVLSEDYESGGYDTFRQSNAIIAMLHVAPASSEGASAVIRHLGSYSPNPGVAEAAFQSLKNLGPESREVFPSLITALRYRKQILYFSEVTRHNGNRGPVGMGNLLAMMQNTNAFVRESAAFGLYGMILVARDVINDPQHQKFFSLGMLDPDPTVRLLSAEILGMATRPDVESLVPVLAGLVQEPDYAIRLRAVDQLRRFAPDQPSAKRLIDKLAENDPVGVVRIWAVEAMR